MMIILSPSKTLDYSPLPQPVKAQLPVFLKETKTLAAIMKRQSTSDLRRLMGISENLAELNRQRFQDFRVPYPEDAAKPALFAFKGDVYEPIPIADYTAEDLKFAEEHLRILSGFYGILRPLDLILPYRLEMGIKLPNPRGEDLYEFWGKRLSDHLNAAMKRSGSSFLVDLASREYAGAIDAERVKQPILRVDFKERKGNQPPKVVAIHAKRMRGVMADWLIRQRIETAPAIERFDTDGYAFDPASSSEKIRVFVRHHPQ